MPAGFRPLLNRSEIWVPLQAVRLSGGLLGLGDHAAADARFTHEAMTLILRRRAERVGHRHPISFSWACSA